MSQPNNPQDTADVTPWEGDYFGRKADADYLTQFLVNGFKDKRYRNQSFVLNLNAKWGFGKTFFLKNWAVDLRNKGHLVISFDAWNNDFSDDALVSFISEISNDLHAQIEDFKDKSAAEDMIEKALNIAVAMPTFAVRIAATMLSDDKKDALAAIDAADFEKTIDIGDFSADRKRLLSLLACNALKENNEKRAAVKEFIGSAKKFVDLVRVVKTEQSLPVFFFIDEIDRCRPNFAINLLESIKHIFPVEGFCFVVATDSEQLCHSISSVYGHGFDSSRYLKRFFDMEYSFLDPKLDDIGFALFSSSNITNKLFIPSNIFSNMNSISVFVEICYCFDLGPRGVQHVFDVLHACCMANASRNLHLLLLMPLICIKYLNPSFFDVLYASRDSDTFKKIVRDGGWSKLESLVYKVVGWNYTDGVLSISLLDMIVNYFNLLCVDDEKLNSGYLSKIPGFNQVVGDLFNGNTRHKEGFIYTSAFDYFEKVRMAGNFSTK